jgi:DNA repair protein SbcC/Rad50
MIGPHLQHIEIDGFRSIDRGIDLPLDAPVVLIHGQNGAGKTSLLSAMELALTGSIPSLERADVGYRKQLVNWYAAEGKILVAISGLEDVVEPITTRVTRGTSRSSGGLPAGLAKIYSERCYLPQTTLSQLLTIYGSDEGGMNTPLSRFAAELLGLDRLDALQRGLQPARDVRNLRPLVPLYRTLEENRAALATELDEAERDLKAVAAELEDAIGALKAEFARADVEPGPGVDLSGRVVERDLARLTDQARRADGLARAREGLEANRAGPGRAELAASAAAAEKKLADWRRGSGEKIVNLLRRASALVQNTAPTVRPAVDQDLARLVTELAQAGEIAKAAEARIQAADNRASQVEDELARARVSMVDFDRRIEATARIAPDLATALAGILPHIHGEDCPVCGRNYSEVSAQSYR